MEDDVMTEGGAATWDRGGGRGGNGDGVNDNSQELNIVFKWENRSPITGSLLTGVVNKNTVFSVHRRKVTV